jgi:putative nucleotidyltransferase with HDIG domain
MNLSRRRWKFAKPSRYPDLERGSGRTEKNRKRRIRLLIMAVSCLVSAALVHGKGPTFGFRLGQRPSREVRLKVDEIQRRNALRSNALRQIREDGVAPRMIHDPKPIEDLIKSLEDLGSAAGRVNTVDELPPNVMQTWGMISKDLFENLREANDVPERRDQFARELREAFNPVLREGILGSTPLPRIDQNATQFAVRLENEPESRARIVTRDSVSPERLSRPESEFAHHFVSSFRPPELGQRLFDLIDDKLAGVPTLSYDERETLRAREQARSEVSDIFDPFKRGDLLVQQNQPIDAETLDLLRLEHERAVKLLTRGEILKRWSAAVGLCISLYALLGFYLSRNEPRLAGNASQLLLLCLMMNLGLGAMRVLTLQSWDAEALPVAVCGMVVTIAFGMDVAIMFTLGLSLLTCLALGVGIDELIVLAAGATAGIVTLGDVRSRTKLIEVGATIGSAYFLLTWAAGLWQRDPVDLILATSLWRAVWGVMAGFFLGGILPFLEAYLGLLTGISLLELGHARHPLLQELVQRAPGTYNHSVTVGALAESAAERIGANALLVRVGAYFHDIGKMVKPEYFIENQVRGQTNRHSALNPAISTMIIIGHVKDGYELGREHNLPQPILDLIQQHHGTTLVEYFYREAARREAASTDPVGIHESAFRYPGPPPQSKEAAILMICDAVESASRTLSDPTPARLEALVDELTNKRLHDGQFDECGLTLKDLAEIKKSLTKSLIGLYHARIKYPEAKSA